MDTAYSNVADFLLEGKDRDATALLLIDREYTYGDLQAAADTIAAYFLRIGATKGDRALLISPNGFFWVAAYLAVLKAGLVCVPVPETISQQDLAFIIESTRARVALLQARFCSKHLQSFSAFHVLTDRLAPPVPGVASQESFNALPDLSAGLLQAAAMNSQDLAALMFTSGSTAKPRGVMVSHRNIIANTESITQYLELTPRDRIMTVLPFHYCFGTSLLHTHLRVGGSLVLESRFLYPEVVLERMLETNCTGFAGVPSHFQILLRTSGMRGRSFPRLRYVQQAGGCLAPHLVRELRDALPNTQVFVMYGQTEATARLSYLPPEFLEAKVGSIGRGIPGIQLKVVNATGDAVRPGEVGEITAAGESVTRGYWGVPEETAETFRNGVLHTGDLATVDPDGFIYIVGRKKNFLKCGGKRISIQEIENRLLEFACITEVAVTSVPDEVLGEAVAAFVVPRMPCCEDFDHCFSSFCKEHLPRELQPKRVTVLDYLPRNSAGKVRRSDLESLQRT